MVTSATRQRFDLRPALDNLGSELDAGFQVRLKLAELTNPKTRQTLDDEADGAIRSPEEAVHQSDRPDGVQVVRLRRLQVGITRGDQADQLIFAGYHFIHQADRARLTNGQWHGCLGVDDQRRAVGG